MKINPFTKKITLNNLNDMKREVKIMNKGTEKQTAKQIVEMLLGEEVIQLNDIECGYVYKNKKYRLKFTYSSGIYYQYYDSLSILDQNRNYLASIRFPVSLSEENRNEYIFRHFNKNDYPITGLTEEEIDNFRKNFFEVLDFITE